MLNAQVSFVFANVWQHYPSNLDLLLPAGAFRQLPVEFVRVRTPRKLLAHKNVT